ncbi:MAG: hypothetical protein R6V44_06625 [Paracoccaceae bacterium]
MLETTLEFFVPMLAMFTLGALLVAAWRGAWKTREMRKDDDIPRSALSEDGDSHFPQTDTTMRQAKNNAA